MDTSEFEHSGGEFFKDGSTRSKVKELEIKREASLKEVKAVMLIKAQEEWLSLDNPFLWDEF